MSVDSLVSAYLDAKDSVIEAGFAAEIDWQEDRVFSRITERELIRQAAWVIVASGMRDSVVRKIFPSLSLAFMDWEDVHFICQCKLTVRSKALRVLNNGKKIDAILSIAEMIDTDGFATVKDRIESEGIGFVQTFPFMGPATSYHLAKNLGLDEVKPDRHLLRVAAASNHPSPADLCRTIARITGERISVIDLVIWRFATLESDYVDHFAGSTKRNLP